MAKNAKKNLYRCAFPHCRDESSVIWLGAGVCQRHLEWITQNPLKKAYAKLQITNEKILANETPIEKIKNKKGLEHFTEKE
jgi:hypothetical protein